jgi:hypothetical protein
MTRIPRIVPLVVLLCACADRALPAEAPQPALPMPVAAVSPEPSWTGQRADEAVVARVGGVPIPAGRLARALAAAGASADRDEVLRALIAEEAVAQAAVREGGDAAIPDRVGFETTLASRFVEDRFIDRYLPADMPRTELDELFALPPIRAKYDHLAVYDVLDLQVICCNGSPRDCATPIAEACFAKGQEGMAHAYDRLVASPPELADVPVALEDLKAVVPELSTQEYQFLYDPQAKVQKGAARFDDAVVEAVVATPQGGFPAPVRSSFGWHIPFVKTYTPEAHRDLSDPAVARELSEFFINRSRQRRFLEYLGTLAPLEAFPGLANVVKGRVKAPPTATDVAFYPALIRQAIQEKSRSAVEEGQ